MRVRLLKYIARVCLLLLVGACVAVLWTYGDVFLAVELMNRGLGRTAAQCWASIATMVLLLVAPAMPIYSLFPRRATLAAAVIGWVPLVMAVAFSWLPDTMATPPMAFWVGLVKGVAGWIAIMAGASVAARYFASRPLAER